MTENQVIVQFDCVNGRYYKYTFSKEIWNEFKEALKKNNWQNLSSVNSNNGLNFAHVVHFEEIE